MKIKIFAGILIAGLVLISGCGTVKNHTNGDRTPLVQYLPVPPEPPPTEPETAAADLIALQVNTDNMNKSFYFPEDKLDITGLELTGDFGEEGNAIRKPVKFNILNFSQDTLTKSGVNTINIKVNEISVNFTVIVDTIDIVSVGSHDGERLIFEIGEDIDPEKLTLTGLFNSGLRKILPSTVMTGEYSGYNNSNSEGAKTNVRVSVNVAGTPKWSNSFTVYNYPKDTESGLWAPTTVIPLVLNANSQLPLSNAIYKNLAGSSVGNGLQIQSGKVKNSIFKNITNEGTANTHYSALNIQAAELEDVIIEDIKFNSDNAYSFSVQFSRSGVSLKNVTFNNITRDGNYAGLYFGGSNSYGNTKPQFTNIEFDTVKKMHLPSTANAVYNGQLVFKDCSRIITNSAANVGNPSITDVVDIINKTLTYQNGKLVRVDYEAGGSIVDETILNGLDQYGE